SRGLRAWPETLGTFLTRDRGALEWQRAFRAAKGVCDRTSEAVERRIPLLDDDVAALTNKIDSVQAEFGTLEALRDRVRQLIRTTGETEANKLADSFKAFILDLDRTFEADFLASQPDLGFLDFLNRNKRDEFARAFQDAFERYLRDRISEWEAQAKPQLNEAFINLNQGLEVEEAAYARTVEIINRKLLQGRVRFSDEHTSESNYRIWFDRIPSRFEEIPGKLNGAFNSFDQLWQGVIQFVIGSLCLLILIQLGSIIVSGLLLNVVGAIAVGGGLFTAQAELFRQRFLSITRKEFSKRLPDIAEEQWSNVYQAIAECFKDYEKRIGDGITADIHARKAELTSLLNQKTDREVDRTRETERLQTLVTRLNEEITAMEALAIAPP
ncbi:MAG: dynamin, partial [Cyanobacteria bacterium J06639_1]